MTPAEFIAKWRKVAWPCSPRLVPRDAECEKLLKDRTLTKLYNARPTGLDLAHRKFDDAVASAYGWPADLSDDAMIERLRDLILERNRHG